MLSNNSIVSLVIAIVVFLLTAPLLPTLRRRWPYVGWRYRIATVSGVVFAACIIAVQIQWAVTTEPRLYMLPVHILLTISGAGLLVTSFGYVDIVFNDKRRVMSSR